MNKLKQCVYTVILILTCVVASPMIFKQIWNASAEKKKAAPKANVEIDITKGAPQTTAPADPNAPVQTDVVTAPPPQIVTDAGGEVVATIPAPVQTTPPPESPVQTPAFVSVEKSYFDDALFIGDSRTVGLSEYGSLDNADYFCNVGLSSAGAYSSAVDGDLSSMLSSGKYSKIYVMLGINEVGNPFDTTFGNYKNLIETIRQKAPNAIVYVEANLRVTAAREDDAINNQRINALNTMMSSLADNSKIFYIDVNPIFDDGSGNLMENCTEDGVHVFAKYYRDWCDWLALNAAQPAAPAAGTAPPAA